MWSKYSSFHANRNTSFLLSRWPDPFALSWSCINYQHNLWHEAHSIGAPPLRIYRDGSQIHRQAIPIPISPTRFQLNSNRDFSPAIPYILFRDELETMHEYDMTCAFEHCPAGKSALQCCPRTRYRWSVKMYFRGLKCILDYSYVSIFLQFHRHLSCDVLRNATRNSFRKSGFLYIKWIISLIMRAPQTFCSVVAGFKRFFICEDHPIPIDTVIFLAELYSSIFLFLGQSRLVCRNIMIQAIFIETSSDNIWWNAEFVWKIRKRVEWILTNFIYDFSIQSGCCNPWAPAIFVVCIQAPGSLKPVNPFRDGIFPNTYYIKSHWIILLAKIAVTYSLTLQSIFSAICGME